MWRVDPSMSSSSCLAARLLGWRAYHSPRVPGLRSRWACLSLAALAWWRGEFGIATKWIRCWMRWTILPTHVSHLLPPPGQHGSELPYISHSSRSQRANVLPAACYLTWVFGCSSAYYCTQTHSAVMIYCLAAYGITLRPDSSKVFHAGKFGLTHSWFEIPGNYWLADVWLACFNIFKGHLSQTPLLL